MRRLLGMTASNTPVSTSISRRRHFVTGATIALIACFALSACDVEGETRHAPRDDVNAGWTCEVERGQVRASGTITNQSSKSSFYVIEVEFRLDGRVVDHSTAGIDDVDPGETARVETSSSDVVDDDVTCQVSKIERYEA